MIDPTSVILACVAIALSVSFFWMSLRMSERVSEATRRIELSVEKLEIVFRTQHEETFSMAKTAFNDFRKRAFTGKTTEEDLSKLADEKTNERIENIRSEISKEMDARISELGKRAKKTDAEISEIKASMDELLGKAITESRHVEKEVKAETLMDRILLAFLHLHKLRKRHLSINDLSEYSNRSVATVGHVLRLLQNKNLVNSEAKGFPKRYSLTPEGIERAEEIESRISRVGGDAFPFPT